MKPSLFATLEENLPTLFPKLRNKSIEDTREENITEMIRGIIVDHKITEPLIQRTD